MQNNDYFVPGVAAIFLAVSFPIYCLAIAPTFHPDILWQDMLSVGLSDMVFLAILLLINYVYLKFKTILNERWNISKINLFILIGVAINTFWMSTLLLDVISAFSSESALAQNRETFLSINLSVTIGVVFWFGVVDLLIGIFLLENTTELPSLLKTYAVLSIVKGVLGITVIGAPVLIFIFPLSLIVLALLFLRKPESIEID